MFFFFFNGFEVSRYWLVSECFRPNIHRLFPRCLAVWHRRNLPASFLQSLGVLQPEDREETPPVRRSGCLITCKNMANLAVWDLSSCSLTHHAGDPNGHRAQQLGRPMPQVPDWMGGGTLEPDVRPDSLRPFEFRHIQFFFVFSPGLTNDVWHFLCV